MRILVFGLVACVACGGSAKPRPQTLSATWSAPTMLSKVPADSPYLMAVLDPMPELVRRQTYKQLDKKLADELAALDLEAVDRSQLPMKEKLLFALRDE